MERTRRFKTVRQLDLMMEFLDGNGDLALGRVRSKEARADSARMWEECAEILNKEGPARTGKEWSKAWNDMKCKVKAKLFSIKANQHGTGGRPDSAPILTRLEEKVANIIGPQSNVKQEQFAANYDDGMVVYVVDEQPENSAASQRASSPIDNNINEAELQTEHVRATSPEHIMRLLPTSPAPSLTGQVPSPQTTQSRITKRDRTVRKRRRKIHSSNRRIPQITTESDGSALEESRLMILKIEKMRAEATLKTAQAVSTVADGLKQIAESIDRLGQKNNFL